MLPAYPDIQVEVIVDYGLTDIVAERYDAGVRLGEQVAKDMIAVRIGPDMRMSVVAAPSYFETRPKPKVPQDLTAHSCIGLRMPTHGGLFAWEFEKRGREVKVRVEGPLVFNNFNLRLEAALAGIGLAYMPEDRAQEYVDARPARARARGLVRALCGIPPLLSKPPPADARFRRAGRSLALSSASLERCAQLPANFAQNPTASAIHPSALVPVPGPKP